MSSVLTLLLTLATPSALAQQGPAPQQAPPTAPSTVPPASTSIGMPAGNPQATPVSQPQLQAPVTRGAGYTFDGVAPRVTSGRSFAMEFNFRGRMVSVPKSILDIWFHDATDESWAWIEGRPRIHGYALGMELVVKNASANGIFYAEFIDSQMKAGYWDDVDSPPDPLDGDFLVPSSGVGMLTFGANYAYEAHIVESMDTMGRFGLSFLVGGGLGMGILTGNIDRWGPDDQGNPAYKRYLDGHPPDGGRPLPRAFPMIDINAGLRFTFGDRYVMRVEGGLHTLLYYGATAGVMF